MSTAMLYAVGEQDAWLTGSPSMTYFQSVYMRHTPFVIETREIPFDTTIGYGLNAISTIPSYGDVITSIKLKTIHSNLFQSSSQYYCWPTWPANINPQPTVYLLINGAFVPAIQPFPSTFYYSTYNLPLWAQNSYTGTISLSASSNNFIWTGTTTIYFLDQASAVFYGMNPRLSDTRVQNAYGFTVTSQRTADFTFFQSGWVQGTVPPLNASYFDGIGTRCIDQAQLLIGGQTVSELTGRYIDLKNDMDVPYENQSGLTVLVGKNDTSQQIIPRVCYTDLEFGTDKIPICALTKQDLRVGVKFAPVSNIATDTSGLGTISDPNSYVVTDLRTIFNTSTYDIYDLSVNNDVMSFTDRYTGKRVFFNTLQQVSNASAYTGPMSTTIPLLFSRDPVEYGRGNNARTVNSNIYYHSNFIYVTRISRNDYYVTNVNSTVTSTYIMWNGGQWGVPLSYNSSQTGDGTEKWEGGSYMSSSGKYLYFLPQINYNYLPTSGISTAWYSISNTATTYTLTHTFFGTTSPSTASILEWVNYVKARDTAITANTVPTTVVSGSNTLVTSTFTSPTTMSSDISARLFGLNKVFIRYDTTQDINSASSYVYYQDFNRLFNYTLVNHYGWYNPGQNESLFMQTDGRYMYMRIGNYIIVVDQLNFTSSNGYSIFNWTSLSPVPGLQSLSPIIFDGTYGYLNLASLNFSRFKIGQDLSLNSSWDVFQSSSSLPWTTIIQSTIASWQPLLVVSGFDGRYIYWVGNGTGASPIIMTYDTTKSFTDASSYSWISKHWSSLIFYQNEPSTGLVSDFRNFVVTDTDSIYVCVRVLEQTHIVRNLDGTVYKTLTGINIINNSGATYIVKYAKSTGAAQWVVWWNGGTTARLDTNIKKLRVDSSGNVYFVGGSQNRGTFYNSNNSVFTPTYGAGDSFGEGVVGKISSTGTIQWIVRTGTFTSIGTRSRGVTDINDMIITSGGVYISGVINGPGGQGSYDATYMNLYSASNTATFKQFSASPYGDAFIAKIDTYGVYQWASNIASLNALDIGTCIGYSASQGVFFAGSSYGSPTTIFNADGTTYGTVTKPGSVTATGLYIMYNETTGAVLRTSVVSNGGTSYWGPSSAVIDSTGTTAYVASYVSNLGGGGIVLSNVSLATLTTQWTSQMYGSNVAINPIVTLDSSGSIYLACQYSSNNFTMYHSNGAVFTTLTNAPSDYIGSVFYDTVISKYSPSGTGQWINTITGRTDEFPIGIDATSDVVYTFVASLSMEIRDGNSQSVIFSSSQSGGEQTGGSRYFLYSHNQTTGAYIANVFNDKVGFDDRFVSSRGTDVVGIYPNLNKGWAAVQGPRYIYMYQSDPNFSTKNVQLWQFDPQTINTSLKASLLVDYAHLMPSEVEWFKNTRHEYVFELVQRMSVPLSLTETFVPLRFEGPVKEMYVTLLQSQNQNTYNYSNVSSLALYLNNEQLFDYDSTLFQFIEPWETKAVFPTRNVFIHTFGSPVNFSRIASKTLRVNAGVAGTLDVYTKMFNVVCFEYGLAGLTFNSLPGLV